MYSAPPQQANNLQPKGLCLLEALVRAIAERAVATVLAATEVNGSILLRSVGSGREVTSLVGSIAEGLRRALAAGAPIVGLACLDSDGDRGFLSDNGFGHKSDG
jgi:hypothetical protein